MPAATIDPCRSSLMKHKLQGAACHSEHVHDIVAASVRSCPGTSCRFQDTGRWDVDRHCFVMPRRRFSTCCYCIQCVEMEEQAQVACCQGQHPDQLGKQPCSQAACIVSYLLAARGCHPVCFLLWALVAWCVFPKSFARRPCKRTAGWFWRELLHGEEQVLTLCEPRVYQCVW